MRKLLLCIVIALAAVCCTKNVDVVPQSCDNVLTISSNLATRVAEGEWGKNDPIGVYMTSESLGDEGANAKYTTALVFLPPMIRYTSHRVAR